MSEPSLKELREATGLKDYQVSAILGVSFDFYMLAEGKRSRRKGLKNIRSIARKIFNEILEEKKE